MKYIDAEKLNAEIERLKDVNRKIKCQANERYCAGYDDAFYDLVPFIDTLEKSEKLMNQDGLEEEIDRLWESFADEMEGPHNLFDIYARLARHFAQWGAEHLKK